MRSTRGWMAGLGAAALVVLAVVVPTVGATPVPTLTSIDGAAEVVTVPSSVVGADRRERSQVEPQPIAPTYGGCLQSGYSTTTVGTAPNTWKRISKPETTYPWLIGFRSTAGPRGAIVVVGDSLTVFSFNSTMTELISLGYGPICMDASVGRMASPKPNGSRSTSGAGVIERIKASDAVWRLDNTTWVVALGTNDVAYASSSTVVEYATAHIADVRTAIGALRVPQYWVNVRTLRPTTQAKEDAWNGVLAAPGVTVIDWSAVVARTPGVHINSTDLVHLTTAGNAVRVPLLINSLRPV